MKLAAVILCLLASQASARIDTQSSTDADTFCSGPADKEVCFDKNGNIVPTTDNNQDLGTSALEFKDLYIDGTARIDNLVIDESISSAGDLSMSGSLTVVSTLTVLGNAASVGGSTLAVTGGRVGILTASPAYPLHVAGTEYATGQGIFGGSLTVQGNAFSVGGTGFSISSTTVLIGTSTASAFAQVEISTNTPALREIVLNNTNTSGSGFSGLKLVAGLNTAQLFEGNANTGARASLRTDNPLGILYRASGSGSIHQFQADGTTEKFRIDTGGIRSAGYVISAGSAVVSGSGGISVSTGASSITSFGSLTNGWGANHSISIQSANGIMVSKQGGNNDTSRLGTIYWDPTEGGQLLLYNATQNSGNQQKIQLSGGGNSWFNTGNNVGIGTTSPGYFLHVASAAKVGGGEAAGPGAKKLAIEMAGSTDYMISECEADAICFDYDTQRSPELRLANGTATIGSGGTPLAMISTGTYTPTCANIANLDGSTCGVGNFVRTGNIVNVFGQFAGDATLTATATELEFTLPVASDIALATDVGGTAVNGAGESARIIGDATDNRVIVSWVPVSTVNQTFSYNFTYVIK